MKAADIEILLESANELRGYAQMLFKSYSVGGIWSPEDAATRRDYLNLLRLARQLERMAPPV